MINRWTTVLVVALLAVQAGAQSPKGPKPGPSRISSKTQTTPAAGGAQALAEKDKASYAVGVMVARNFKQQGLQVDPSIFMQGFRAAQSGGKLQMTDQEMQQTLMAVQAQVMAKMRETQAAAASANQKEGAAFLAANKSKPGVVTLPDGLQYKILTEGTGKKPTDTDTVEVNYRGTLINGKEFDSSYKRGQPATFQVGGVIKGWTEALKLMPVGSKWQLFVPAELAYGDRAMGPDIAPGSTLIFDVELLSIK